MDWPDGQIDGGGDTNSGPLHRLGDRERTGGEKTKKFLARLFKLVSAFQGWQVNVFGVA